jgi:hypothetical protein
VIISERSSEDSRYCHGAPLLVTFLMLQVHRTVPEFCPLLCLISDTVIYVMMLSFAGIMLCDCM